MLRGDGPQVTERDVLFSVRAPGRSSAVLLDQDLRRHPPEARLERRRGTDRWELHWPRDGVDRMEYRFRVVGADGGATVQLDPGNPLLAPNVFGDRSVVEFPGYRRPGWLAGPRLAGRVRTVPLPAPSLGGRVHCRLWSAAGSRAGEPLPLLLVHDGPDYERYAGLTRLLDRLVADGGVQPMRAALLAPVDRDDHYSASPAYAHALAGELLPALADLAPSPPGCAPVGLGASLGALALLHAQRASPGLFAGLLLQSGSFFQGALDPQEAGHAHFARMCAFVEAAVAAPAAGPSVPVTLTCGTVEENLANNRAMALALAAQGHQARLRLGRDAHNWVAWRDLLDPNLSDLLGRCWPAPRPPYP